MVCGRNCISYFVSLIYHEDLRICFFMLMTSDDFLIHCTEIQTGRMGRNTVEEPKSKRCAVNWFNRKENQQEGNQKLTLHTSCIEGTSYNRYLRALSNGSF